MCTHSNVFSRPVLIARGLDFELHLPLCSFQVRVRVPARLFVRPCDGARFSAAIAEGSHLFPFRTEKLSPPAPMVLPGRPGGRVGRRPSNVTKPRCASAGAFVLSSGAARGPCTLADTRQPRPYRPGQRPGARARAAPPRGPVRHLRAMEWPWWVVRAGRAWDLLWLSRARAGGGPGRSVA